MSFLQIVDIVILIAVIIFGIIGFSKGLSKKLFAIVSFIAAFIAVIFLSTPIIELFGYGEAPTSTKCLFYVGVFVVVFLIIRILGAIFDKGIKNAGFSFFNRLLGLAWGVLEVLLIAWVVLLLAKGVMGFNFVSDFIEEQNLFEDKGWGLTLYLYEHNLIPAIINALQNGGGGE